jgi:hypothetical protein
MIRKQNELAAKSAPRSLEGIASLWPANPGEGER